MMQDTVQGVVSPVFTDEDKTSYAVFDDSRIVAGYLFRVDGGPCLLGNYLILRVS